METDGGGLGGCQQDCALGLYKGVVGCIPLLDLSVDEQSVGDCHDIWNTISGTEHQLCGKRAQPKPQTATETAAATQIDSIRITSRNDVVSIADYAFTHFRGYLSMEGKVKCFEK